MSVLQITKENEELSLILRNRIEGILERLVNGGGQKTNEAMPPNSTILDSAAISRTCLRSSLDYINHIETLLFEMAPTPVNSGKLADNPRPIMGGRFA